MTERSPLFLGLARPPKYLGLPVGYLVVLAMGVVLPFIWTKSLVFFLIGIIAYPVLWFVADKEPHFFEVLRVSCAKPQVVCSHTPMKVFRRQEAHFSESLRDRVCLGTAGLVRRRHRSNHQSRIRMKPH